MKRFYCSCGQETFFGNTFCGACGAQLGFDAESQRLLSLTKQEQTWYSVSLHQSFSFCSNHFNTVECNWLIPDESDASQCMVCSTTRTIPMLDLEHNWRRWRTLESAKRRLFYGLLQLGLPIRAAHQGYADGLLFDFLEDQRTNPDVDLAHVLSGHAAGVITLNAAEADDSYREATREAMNEPYRTLLGHFRHEIGHFYWDQLIKDSQKAMTFVEIFGDYQQDYRASLDDYYVHGPTENWHAHYISAYASAHPLEDWAETWAHYMLMMETLETALAYDLVDQVDNDQLFDNWLSEWMALAVVMNALNRSTGQSDAYPFVISEPVRAKLRFIHELVQQTATG
jgi:hypothetical protein